MHSTSGFLHKNHDTSLPSNYRPIFLLCQTGKVMERIFIITLSQSLQSDFVPCDSANYQLLISYQAGDNGKEVRDVFCDISKVSKAAKIRNLYNQVPHLTQDTNGKVTNSQYTPQTRAKRSALSQQVTTKHI